MTRNRRIRIAAQAFLPTERFDADTYNWRNSSIALYLGPVLRRILFFGRWLGRLSGLVTAAVILLEPDRKAGILQPLED